jgi:NADH dehydrogenase FAD-containing subunit
VTLIDQLPADRIAPEAIPDHRNPLIIRLKNHGVQMLTEHVLEEIRENDVVVISPKGEKKALEADTVVLAVGTRPCREMEEQLLGKVPELHIIGDSAGFHRIADALYWGAITGSRV